MSENQNRGTIDYAKYDSMATEELEEILRLDAQAPEGQASDGELLLYVMEVLTNRKRNSANPGKTAQQAWESFEKNYLPAEEENIIPITKTEPFVKAPRHWLRRMIAAAAVLVVLVGVPLTANAFGWEDIWNAVAQWAKETFSFVTGSNTQITEPDAEDIHQYTALQELLAQTDQETDFVPTWIPEGYKLEDIRMDESPIQKNYLAVYVAGEKFLKISIKSYIEGDPEKVEVHDDILEIYEVSGTEYYIFINNEQLRAAWIKDSYECHISGDLTIEEIKTMIDSIGKG